MNSLKEILSFMGLFPYFFCASQQVNFSIKGHLQNKTISKQVFLQGEIDEVVPLDTNKNFTYSGSLKEPGLLLLKTENSYAWGVWVNEGQIDITIEQYYGEGMDSAGKKLLRVTAISGPLETEKSQWFTDFGNALIRKYFHIPTSQRTDTVSKYYYPVLEEYVLNHPNTKLSAYLTNGSTYRINTDSKEKLLALLNKEANAEEAKRIENSIARERLLKPGNLITNFKQPTLDGKLFSLDALSNPYTLLEFWSSSCIPCRAGNPELVKLYNQYRPKGFEIVGISLDNSKEAWKKAVKKDGLPWIHVSDLKGWNNAVASKYLVDATPFNILIDRNHRIIATNINITGMALRDKLEELVNSAGSR